MSLSTILDSLVGIFFPKRELERIIYRQHSSQIKERYLDAGRLDRTTKPWDTKPQAGDEPDLGQIRRSRSRAWHLFRNNQYISKAVRTIVSEVVGTGLIPNPLAVNPNGTENTELRKRIRKLWKIWNKSPSYHGLPGQGGCGWSYLCAQALREVVLSGEVLCRKLILSEEEARTQHRLSRFVVELIESERLAEDYSFSSASRASQSSRANGTVEGNVEGKIVFRGIEYSDTGQRLAYWIRDYHPNDLRIGLNIFNLRRIPASEIIHLYIPDRPSQNRGITWLAPVLLQARDVSDYQQNELMASAVAACVALAITRLPSATPFGLATPTSGDVLDVDGNRISRLQPGLALSLNPGESISGFNPLRPVDGVEDFSNHLVRGVATGLPAIKASSLTGDYRRSSFSSERSAENDIWREVNLLQDWFACNFCQPLYEALLEVELMEVYDFANPEVVANITDAIWSGPVPKSINPEDDQAASVLSIQSGTSSRQIEAAKSGYDWKMLLEHEKEYEDARAKLGLKPKTLQALPEPDESEPDESAKSSKPNGKPNSQRFSTLLEI